MNRADYAIVACFVCLFIVGPISVADQVLTDRMEGSEINDSTTRPAPGERLSMTVGSHEAHVSGSYRGAMFERGLAEARTDHARAQRLLAFSHRLDYRTSDLDRRQRKTIEQYRTGEINETVFRYRMARITAHARVVNSLAAAADARSAGLSNRSIHTTGLEDDSFGRSVRASNGVATTGTGYLGDAHVNTTLAIDTNRSVLRGETETNDSENTSVRVTDRDTPQRADETTTRPEETVTSPDDGTPTSSTPPSGETRTEPSGDTDGSDEDAGAGFDETEQRPNESTTSGQGDDGGSEDNSADDDSHGGTDTRSGDRWNDDGSGDQPDDGSSDYWSDTDSRDWKNSDDSDAWGSDDEYGSHSGDDGSHTWGDDGSDAWSGDDEYGSHSDDGSTGDDWSDDESDGWGDGNEHQNYSDGDDPNYWGDGSNDWGDDGSDDGTSQENGQNATGATETDRKTESTPVRDTSESAKAGNTPVPQQ